MIVGNFFLSIVKRLDKALAKGDRGTVRQIEAVMCSDKRREVDTTNHLLILAIEHGLEHASRHLNRQGLARRVWFRDCHFRYILAATVCTNRAMLPFIAREILVTDEAILEAALWSAKDACEPEDSVPHRKRYMQNARENAEGYLALLSDESLFHREISQFPEQIRWELAESLPIRRALKNLPQAQAEIKQTAKRL